MKKVQMPIVAMFIFTIVFRVLLGCFVCSHENHDDCETYFVDVCTEHQHNHSHSAARGTHGGCSTCSLACVKCSLFSMRTASISTKISNSEFIFAYLEEYLNIFRLLESDDSKLTRFGYSFRNKNNLYFEVIGLRAPPALEV